MLKSFSDFQKDLIAETVIPKNTSGGFLGTAGNDAHRLLDHAVDLVKKATRGIKELKFTDLVISHFLDSRGGRQLAELLKDNQPDEVVQSSLKKSIATFTRAYNPGLFEDTLDDGEDSEDGADVGQITEEGEGQGGVFSSNPVRKGKAVGHLRRLMREPLKAHEAHDKIKPHAHDKRLLHDVKHFAGKDPHADVRPILKKRMRELKIEGF
jgi:Trp operon repressor